MIVLLPTKMGGERFRVQPSLGSRTIQPYPLWIPDCVWQGDRVPVIIAARIWPGWAGPTFVSLLGLELWSALRVASAQLSLDVQQRRCQLRLQQRVDHDANDLLSGLQLVLHLQCQMPLLVQRLPVGCINTNLHVLTKVVLLPCVHSHRGAAHDSLRRRLVGSFAPCLYTATLAWCVGRVL